ncbi:peptidoglycan editing factor PgeF [Vibrio ulleungensis]|uniref:Purine nucleoside phosphorylase n=1 Tax=Vibrio ulleungensis TaxID=2807619 RepID=A0ABS2HJ59_9VIBR|nr:peptidoglycan editing factor PgeF [Vibrio ulleungensis]MBM7037563.1 peptidoglycan editing factor PgeF [Vibrio ulleungensis]
MSWIVPNWNAPKNVKAISTTREGGFSSSPFDGLNLGRHVGDDFQTVERNRHWLMKKAQLPSSPAWLNQTHSTHVVVLPLEPNKIVSADASLANAPGQVCSVMTADCVPVLFCNSDGTQVAAAHAGWRGLLNGILENTIEKIDGRIIAWVGPAIRQPRFEVGSEVRQQFIDCNGEFDRCFVPSSNAGKWMADLEQLVSIRLVDAGVSEITISGLCTYDDVRFFSYRQHTTTGRQASMIWIES